MTNEMKIDMLNSRIHKLTERDVVRNGKIINKLKRQVRALEATK